MSYARGVASIRHRCWPSDPWRCTLISSEAAWAWRLCMRYWALLRPSMSHLSGYSVIRAITHALAFVRARSMRLSRPYLNGTHTFRFEPLPGTLRWCMALLPIRNRSTGCEFWLFWSGGWWMALSRCFPRRASRNLKTAWDLQVDE